MSRRKLASAIRANDAAALGHLREAGTTSLDGETFKQLHLADVDLGGLDLSNTEWDSCMLDRVSFSGTNLDGAYFTGTTLMACGFEAPRLEGTSFDGCVLHRSSFSKAGFDGVELGDAQLNGCTLEALTLDAVDWRSVAFNNCRIVAVQGRSGTLVGVTIRGGDVSGFDSAGLDVEHCSCTEEPAPAGFVVRRGRRKKL